MVITTSDISTYKPISTHANNDEVLNYEKEALEFDVRPLLGDKFYTFLISSINDPNIQTLLNGTTQDGVKYEGLKAVVVYYTWARYIQYSSEKDTPFGMVNKNSDFSNLFSGERRAAMVTQARSGAYSYWKQMEDFLNNNKTTYPLFESNCKTNVNAKIRFRTID
jgi:hypothetical protein